MKSKNMIAIAIVFLCVFSHRYSLAGEWDRMPNKNLPRLGKIISSGLTHTVIISSNGNNVNGFWSGSVASIGNNSVGQLGRISGNVTEKCSGTGNFTGDPNWFYVKKWGIEPIVINPLEPPFNDGNPPQLETCSDLNNVFYVASGWNHNLAVRANGEVRAWGNNTGKELGAELTDNYRECAVVVLTREDDIRNGASVVPLNDIIAVDAGKSHSIALRADGRVFSWGTSTIGALGQGPSTINPCQTAKPVKYRPDPNSDIYVDLKYIVAISSGDDHCLALDAYGNVWAWGSNSDGQLGINSTVSMSYAVKVVNTNGGNGYLTNVVSIDAAPKHSLAVLSNGEAVSWGDNEYGQLALYDYNPQIDNSYFPQFMYYAPATSGGNPIKIRDVTALSGCRYSTITLLANGYVKTSGRNVRGVLAINSDNENEEFRYFVATELEQRNLFAPNNNWHIASGDACHFINANSVCGDNSYYQAGVQDLSKNLCKIKVFSSLTGSATNYIGQGIRPVAVAGGAGNTWVMLESGLLNGWGWNYHWHVGTPQRYRDANQNTQYLQCNANVSVLNQYNFSNLMPSFYYDDVANGDELWMNSRGIAAGLRHTSILSRSGKIYSWGSNIGAELCMGSAVNCSYTNTLFSYTRNPILWHPSSDVKNLESNTSDNNGPVYVVAIGTNKGCSDVPDELGDIGYKGLKYPNYAVTSTGRVVGWGYNKDNWFQLTQANNVNFLHHEAVYIMKSTNVILDNIVSVAAGQAYGIALDANGKIWMWGKFEPSKPDNLPFATQINVEKLVGGSYEDIDIRFKEIVASGFANEGNFIMALASDGNVYTLGVNRYNQCGRIDVSENATKLRIIRDNEVAGTKLNGRTKSFDASYLTSVALRADGTIWSWGLNYKGQFGDCNPIPPIPNYLPHQAEVTPCDQRSDPNTIIKYLDNITTIANTCECTFGMDASGLIKSSGQNSYKLTRGLENIISNNIQYFDVGPSRLDTWNPPEPPANIIHSGSDDQSMIMLDSVINNESFITTSLLRLSKVSVALLSSPLRIKLFNALGECIVECESIVTLNDWIEHKLPSFCSGIYFLTINTNDNKAKVIKIIKD